MGKWLSNFLAEYQDSLPDIPDSLSNVSGLSGPDTRELVEIAPVSPLQPGWLVVYQNRGLALCGGFDDREHGTVEACQWDGQTWTVKLTDGQHLSLIAIRSVGQTDSTGRLVAAWTVREHGYDGSGSPDQEASL